ncbi:inorganic phosphate transporter [Candidatus Gracilibacteria bacterium 28_42_T64]|nr:inorganic phosphate transporter [Candidatus Gracilibacteria bacterium 28_42_T64]
MFNVEKKEVYKYIIAAVFLLGAIAWVYIMEGGNTSFYLFFAAILGIYMAINIGANDVANNMGPAVGSKAITLTGAIIIAAIFEASGAIIAGGDVVDTIKGGIINGDQITNQMDLVAIMLSTLLGAAVWLNIATYFKAPVSATHSIIGALLGAGIISYGFGIVNWIVVGKIAASWVISPVLGGTIAAILLLSIRRNILKKESRGDAAKIWVPVYVGLMSAIFSIYLLIKGLKPLLKSNESLANIITPSFALFAGVVIGILVYIALILHYKKQSSYFKNSKSFINTLFNVPLICSVALLSFAHGANDVANAIGPLAAINDIFGNGIEHIQGSKASVEKWIMILGALGIVVGLSVFGARLIKTVGGEITKLNQIRAFCVALSAAVTVLIASQLGLPVSSTHIAIGGIFGVGLLREHIKRQKGKDKEYIEKAMIKNIALAWIITLPVSGLISAGMYFILMKI